MTDPTGNTLPLPAPVPVQLFAIPIVELKPLP